MTCNNFIINNEIIFNVDDCELRPLHEEGEIITLNAPTARCLRLLLENGGQVVSRDDFLEQVWMARGIVVSQNTFYQNISLLRKSLKNAGLTDEIIVTVRRKGFILSSDAIIEMSQVGSHEHKGHITRPDNAPAEDSQALSSTTVKHNKAIPPSGASGVVLKLPRWMIVLFVIFIIAELCSIVIRHSVLFTSS